MKGTLVPKVGVVGLLSTPLLMLTFHVYVVRELLAALLFFSLFFWAMTIPLFILTVLVAASWNLVARFAALVAHLRSHWPYLVVRPTTAGNARD
jgi:hypothetical protein